MTADVPFRTATDGNTLSGALVVTFVTLAEPIVAQVPLSSLTWFDVVPVNDDCPVPQLPAPCSSVQTKAIWPVTGSTLIDG